MKRIKIYAKIKLPSNSKFYYNSIQKQPDLKPVIGDETHIEDV